MSSAVVTGKYLPSERTAPHGPLKVRREFTSDQDRLLQTLDQLKADPGPDTGAAVDVDRQLLSLHAAVQMLAFLNGKKAVIYFTEPLGQRDQPWDTVEVTVIPSRQ